MVMLQLSFNLLFDFNHLHQQFWWVYILQNFILTNFDFYDLSQFFWVVYKFQNLILTNFLDIIWNIFDFYDLSQRFLVVPGGARAGGVGVVKIAKSHFDKFCRHFKHFGTLYELSQIILGALEGTKSRISLWQIFAPFQAIRNIFDFYDLSQ